MSRSLLRLLRDARQARRQGPAAIERRQRVRLAETVTFARANSPYYRELYQGLSEQIDDPARLPVTDKKALMARFGIIGPPTIVFFSADGSEQAAFRVVGFMKAGAFAEHLRGAFAAAPPGPET